MDPFPIPFLDEYRAGDAVFERWKFLGDPSRAQHEID